MAHRFDGLSHRDDVVHTRHRGLSGPPGNTGNGKLRVRTRVALKERVDDLMCGDREDPEALLEPENDTD